MVAYSLDVLPQVLVIHVKRFQYNSKHARYMKNHAPIKLNASIDVKQYCTSEVTNVPMHDLGPVCIDLPPNARSSSNTAHVILSDNESPSTPARHPTEVPNKRQKKNSSDIGVDRGRLKSGNVGSNGVTVGVGVDVGAKKSCTTTTPTKSLSKRKLAILECEQAKKEAKRRVDEDEWGRGEMKPPKTRKTFKDVCVTQAKQRQRDEQQTLDHQYDEKQLARGLAESMKGEDEGAKYERELKEAKRASIQTTSGKPLSTASATTASSSFSSFSSLSSSSSSSSSLSAATKSKSNDRADVVIIDVSSPSDGSSTTSTTSSIASLDEHLPPSTVNNTHNQVQFVSKDAMCSSTQYTLHSIVRHSGKDAFAGHYTTDVRQKDGKWSRYDDARVHKGMSLKEVTNGERNPREAYVLFYCRDPNTRDVGATGVKSKETSMT